MCWEKIVFVYKFTDIFNEYMTIGGVGDGGNRMMIFRRYYARRLLMAVIYSQQTTFEYISRSRENMDRLIGTEGAIFEMRSIFVRNKRRLYVRNIEEEACTQAGKLGYISLQLRYIIKEVGVKSIDRLLKDIFEN